MRIYTEVIFKWDDKQGKLVETSSESFDYSGEMALCKWEDTWEYLGTDDGGVEYQLRGSKRGGAWKAFQVQKRLPGRDWEMHSSDSTISKTYRIGMINEALYTITNSRTADGGAYGSGLHTTYSKWQGWYELETNYEPSDDTAANLVNVERAQSEEYTWVESENAWELISGLEADPDKWQVDDEGVWSLVPEGDDDGDGVDDGDGDGTEFDYTLLSKDEARKAADTAIAEKIKEWEKLTTIDVDDTVELMVKGYISDLVSKEADVRTAYEDIFGVEGEEEGTIWDVKEDWETLEERGKEKYTTDIGTAVTEREEGLEDTVVGREEELEALREEAGGEIRAAEAKIGAAGFASTGVGRTARDMLAEEIGGAARDIDVGFTEERSDVKQSYLTKTDPLEKEFGEGGTAYDDYIRDRDRAARTALAPWETASKEYTRAKTAYEDIYLPSAQLTYETELGDIGTAIMGHIADVRSGVYTDEEDLGYNPFAAGTMIGKEGYTAAQFGLDPISMMFTGVPTDAPMDFYTPYEDPGLGLELYDPDKSLPWEEPTAP